MSLTLSPPSNFKRRLWIGHKVHGFISLTVIAIIPFNDVFDSLYLIHEYILSKVFQLFMISDVFVECCYFFQLKQLSNAYAKQQIFGKCIFKKIELWIFSKVFKGYIYLILKLTLCSFIRYKWILVTIGYLWEFSMSKMDILVVNLASFWN